MSKKTKKKIFATAYILIIFICMVFWHFRGISMYNSMEDNVATMVAGLNANGVNGILASLTLGGILGGVSSPIVSLLLVYLRRDRKYEDKNMSDNR